MEPETFDALRAAVTIAKEHHVTSRTQLRRIMTQRGFTDEQVSEAIVTWENYERSKRMSEEQ